MEEEQQGLKESSLEFKLKDRKETRGREERGREKERKKTQTVMRSIMIPPVSVCMVCQIFFPVSLVPLIQRNKVSF